MNKYYTENGVFEAKYCGANWVLHRLDGPAVELIDGTKKWCVNDKFHRLDGPAIEWSDGDKEYWINDVDYHPSEFYSHIEVVRYLQLDKIILTQNIKDLIQEYKKENSSDNLQVIQDYFLENDLLINSTYSDILLDVITYHNFK